MCSWEREQAELHRGSLRGLAFSKQGSQGVKGNSQHESTKTLPEYQELGGLGWRSISPSPLTGSCFHFPFSFPKKRAPDENHLEKGTDVSI